MVQLDGPVKIQVDRATLTAQQAVVWLTPDPRVEGQQRAEIVLLGDAQVVQPEATAAAAGSTSRRPCAGRSG